MLSQFSISPCGLITLWSEHWIHCETLDLAISVSVYCSFNSASRTLCPVQFAVMLIASSFSAAASFCLNQRVSVV